MALISAGKSNGLLDTSCFLSSLFLSRIVKWSFWLVTKLNAAENHSGIPTDVCWCMHVATPLVFTLMEFVELPEYVLKPRLSISFKKEQCFFTTLLVYLELLSWCVLRRGFWLNMHFLARIQACWKTSTKISKDRLYDLFLTRKSLGRMPASQTK